jgi:hypothetical protein
VTLAAAKANAGTLYFARMTCPEEGVRRLTVAIRRAISGVRFLRVQRASGDMRPLVIAELEAFASPSAGFADWQGGAELTAGSYDGADGLGGTFSGAAAAGTWLLDLQVLPPAAASGSSVIVDDAAAALAATAPLMLSTWQLRLTCDAGEPDWDGGGDDDDGQGDPLPLSARPAVTPGSSVTRTYEAGVTVSVSLWPRHGRLAALPREPGADESPSRLAQQPLLSTAALTSAAANAALSEAAFQQCPDGARVQRNLDGSQSACGGRFDLAPQPLYLPGMRVPDVGEVPRLLELDWPRSQHMVSYDPHLGWSRWGRTGGPLGLHLPALEVDGSVSSDVLVYTARMSHDTASAGVEHRLELKAER